MVEPRKNFLKKLPENLEERKKGINFALAKRKQRGEPQAESASENDSVAQLVEQMTLNHWVVGSSPTGVTKQNGKTPQSTEIT